MKQRICSKAAELSKVEFSYTNSCNFDIINTMDLDCSGLVMDAVVFALKIKNIPLLLKTGKRLAARIYKIYYHTLLEISKETGGYLNCYSPDSFLIIYPKEQHNVSDVVNIALKTAELISMDLREAFEPHGHINFAIGIDTGNVLGTKTLCNNQYSQSVWFGTAIDKAFTIADQCNRPFFVGVSGTVFHHLSEDLLTTTKRILGIKKKVDLWTKQTYMFDNVKKHLYQTNFHKNFDEE